MIRIVLAENHNVVRQGISALLQAEPDIDVIAEAADGQQAIELVAAHKPEVLVLDWMLPLLNGLEVTRRVREMDLQTKILVLSMHAEESYAAQALKYGAVGYVLKDSSKAELIQAVRASQRGEFYLSEPFSLERIRELVLKLDTGKLDPLMALTDREREVLIMVAEGHTSREVAGRLAISPRTVESYRANIFRKLNLETISDLTKYAVRRGLISSE